MPNGSGFLDFPAHLDLAMQRLMTRMLPVLLTGLVLFTGCMPPGGGGKGGKPVNPTAEMLKMLMFMGVFFVIMYVLMIRPQQKKQKAHEEMLTQLKNGDRVVAGGVVGTITAVKKDTVMVKSGESKLEFYKTAVSDKLGRE